MKIGIDDAGRGPVLGPMILAGILLTEEQEQEIKNLKVKDSKLLTPTQRKKIGDILKSYRHHIELATPSEIDAHKNLNLLEAEKCAKIINTLTNNPQPLSEAPIKRSAHQAKRPSSEAPKIIIDCPSTNIPAWTNSVKQILHDLTTHDFTTSRPHDLTTSRPHDTIIAEHKADANHPIVSAASILAKEKREEEIKKLKLKYKIDFGSGYPADPKTIKFIKQNFSNPKYKNLIRHSWSTIKKLHQPKQQKLF